MFRTREFWEQRALHPVVRVLLVIAVGVLVCVAIGFTVATREFSRSDLLALVFYAGIATFVWRPMAASFIVMAVCSVGVVFLGSGGDLLELAITLGLVAATCVPGVVIAHAALLVTLATYVAIYGTALADGGLFGVAGIAAIALSSGLAFRIVAAREIVLIADRARVVRDLGLIAREEQEKIADELHDGIAHDLTLVLFHARALPFQPDETSRAVSLTTIEASAERALTSIQSLLSLIRDHAQVHSAEGARYEGRLVEAASSLAAVLTNAGIPTSVGEAGGSMPRSLEAERLLREIVVEAVTNIIKHAPSSQSVRIDINDHPGVVELVVANFVPVGIADHRKSSGGRGLVRARQRLERVGGRLAAGPTANGWLVRATVPVVRDEGSSGTSRYPAQSAH